MFFIQNSKGQAHGMFGWTTPEFGLHYRSKEEAEAARQQSPALAACTVEKVVPKPPPGVDANGAAAIFGYKKAAPNG